MCLAQLCQLNFTIWSRLVFKRRDMILDAIRWQPMLANSLSADWKRRLGSWCYLERVRVMVMADAVEYGQVSWFIPAALVVSAVRLADADADDDDDDDDDVCVACQMFGRLTETLSQVDDLLTRTPSLWHPSLHRHHFSIDWYNRLR